jgi:3-hydroxyacyl-CoA dehydrogenase
MLMPLVRTTPAIKLTLIAAGVAGSGIFAELLIFGYAIVAYDVPVPWVLGATRIGKSVV